MSSNLRLYTGIVVLVMFILERGCGKSAYTNVQNYASSTTAFFRSDLNRRMMPANEWRSPFVSRRSNDLSFWEDGPRVTTREKIVLDVMSRAKSFVRRRKLRNRRFYTDDLASLTLSTQAPSFMSLKRDVDSWPHRYSRPVRASNDLRFKKKSTRRNTSRTINEEILVGVLLPFAGNRPFVVRKVAPSIEKAVDKVTNEMGPWNFGK